MTIYKTQFINKRDVTANIHEYGRPMFKLEPGQSASVESFDPKTTFARWQQIIFKSKNQIDFVENKQWVSPFKEPTIELLNSEGVPIQALTIGGQTVNCPLSIPVTVEVPVNDAYFKWKKIEWKKVSRKVPREGMPDYLEEREFIDGVRTPRPQEEIDKYKGQK